ncbi:MAG: hypothetical protein JXB49_12895 [Bacteroidales bacterium]|nr:hypothetical protein [Bacteroidales bacterium]
MMAGLKYLFVTIIGLYVVNISFPPSYDPQKKFTVDQLKEDFATLQRLIEENHPALYRYYDEKFFVNYFDSVYMEINTEMTELEFIKIIEPVIAKLHCGHSELWYSEQFEDYVYENNLFLPISVYYIHDRAYVRKHYLNSNESLEGAEIISINGESASNIQRSLFSSMNGDGYNKQNILFTINKTPASIISKYFDYTETYQIKLLKPRDTIPSVYFLDGIKYETLIDISNERYPVNSVNADLDFVIIDSLNTAVIKIGSFASNSNDNYYGFLQSAFRQIETSNMQNLIIDVRGNDGGTPDYSIELLKYLVNHDFIYFRNKLNNTEWNYPIKPYNDNFKGDLFILIDGGELSTTGHFISLLRYHNVGKFIGQESGSTFTCHDNCLEFTLPNTKIRGKVPRTTFETAVSGLSSDRGIIPDYCVESNIEDIIENKDTIMKYALRLISQKRGNK